MTVTSDVSKRRTSRPARDRFAVPAQRTYPRTPQSQVLQWNCHDCPFTAWGRTSDALEQLIARHIVDHHSETLRDVDVGVAWSCPYCASTGYKTRHETAIEGFRGHIRTQHMDQFELLDRDVGAEIDGGGGILIDAAPASDEAATAITYVHQPATASIIITSRPNAHVKHLDRYPTALPEQMSLVTTRPVSEFETTNLTADMLTVERPESGSLGALGEAIARVLGAFGTTDQPVCVVMDIFPEMLDNFEETAVFQFVYTLCERAKQDGTLVYFLLDTQTRSDTTVETFRNVFALELTTSEAGLVETGLQENSSFR